MSKVVLSIYHFLYKLHEAGVPFIPNLLNKLFLRILFSCQIGLGAKIGENCSIAYGGLGVVIHDKAVIKDNVVIGPWRYHWRHNIKENTSGYWRK